MYAWIWRRLPGGTPGKIAGVVVGLAGIAGLLWYGAFPVVDRMLPTNDVQVTPVSPSPSGTAHPPK